MAQGTPSWLNLDFTQGILRRHEADNSIEVIDMFTKPATNKGDNYTSDMHRVFLEITRDRGGKKITEKRSIILKVAPNEEGARKDLIIKSDIFTVEIHMMTDTLERMNDLFGNAHRFNAKVIYVHNEAPTTLILEDLALKGFRMADREAGLDLKHCILAIRNIARFHASSVVVCEKDPKETERYTKGMFTLDTEEMSRFFVQAAHGVANAVETWPEFGKKYADKIHNVAECIFEKSREAVARKDDEFNVINHGDVWVNNMLFRYNEAGEPVEHIFVDFQLCVYTTPAVDLLYFLSTSPSPSVTDEDREFLLQEYLKTLTNTLKQIGCKKQPPTMAQLKKTLKERALYGMMASFAVLPVVLIDKSEVRDVDEMLGTTGEYNNPGCKTENYRKIMSKRIPEYEKMGLLDV